MSINLTMPELQELKPKITVIGVGGAGGNAVNNMIGAELQGVEFVAGNTDAQALANSKADHKIQLGVKITQGLGAGSRPEVGRAAAEETIDALEDALAGCHMTFITAGMGGGTGTGAAPVVARLAREKGILTVGVVTKPFQFEGSRRMAVADQGIEDLKEYVDTLIIIPNQNLFRVANEKTTFADAFAMADQVLHSGVRGITDLMVMPGLINLDFADIRTVMADMGKAMMGTGEAEGEQRAIEAAEAAISNPLLDEVSMKGAKGVIINITGGPDLTLFEVDEAANHIRSEVDDDANIIVGSAFNDELQGRMRVSVVATGVGGRAVAGERPSVILRTVETIQSREVQPVTPIQAAAESNPEAAEPDDLAIATDEETVDVEAPEADVAAAWLGDDIELAEDLDAADPLLADSETFIAPEPAIPDHLVTPMAGPLDAPDAFAEAALTNGSGETGVAQEEDAIDAGQRTPEQVTDPAVPATDRPLSLFERMTSGFRNGEDMAASPDAVAGTRSPAVTTIHPEDIDPPKAAGANAELGGIGPDDRPVPRATADHLEIPSFLRRQAN